MAVILLLAVSLGLLANGASGGSVPAIFVFGDSTADAGNNNGLRSPPAARANFAPYGIDYPGGTATGRFSNGFNGIDYLAQMLGFPQGPPAFFSLPAGAGITGGANYASGGSGILDTTGFGDITLTTQLVTFRCAARLLPPPLVTSSLFLISVGSNDIFAFFKNSGGQNQTANELFMGFLADQLMAHVTSLYGLGARKFGFIGTSIIGCVPAMRSANPSGGCIEELNGLSQMFNDAVEARLQALSSRLIGLNYSIGKSLYLMNLVLANPGQFGYVEVETACCGSGKFNGEAQCGPNTVVCPNHQDHLFWDYFHPTQVTYQLFATHSFNDATRNFASPIDLRTLAAL